MDHVTQMGYHESYAELDRDKLYLCVFLSIPNNNQGMQAKGLL